MKTQRELNAIGQQLWDTKAEFWDELHGAEGNEFHRLLISPSVESLLQLQPDEHVLDVACGNGVLARRMAELGAYVTAVDFSAALLRMAQQHPQAADSHPIYYQQIDVMDEDALKVLGKARFHAITCTMALMDIPDIAPLFKAAHTLLKPGGRMVIATAHPAFNSNNPAYIHERADTDGQIRSRHLLMIEAYADIPPKQGVGAPGEPNAHYYYHRTVEQLLHPAFAAGFMLDGLREPAYPPGSEHPMRRWANLWQIPPVLTMRLRRTRVSRP